MVVRIWKTLNPSPWIVSEKKGGRKKASTTLPELKKNFLEVLRDYTAGDPMREGIRWTNLTRKEIVERLAKTSTPVSDTVVKQLLEEHQFVRRKARKVLAMGEVAGRNEQFERIKFWRHEYWDSPDPILSMDTKKKEHLGKYYREGRLYTRDPLRVYDHDFEHAADGVIIPRGLYDSKRNVGHLYLGLSCDTSLFVCDSIAHWWFRFGRRHYPRARSLLLLSDSGGSNDCRHYIFKEDLQALADRLNLEIRVAHYPPYCSKYNPIEHRLFPHMTRACRGVILDCLETYQQLVKKTRTSTGLRVTVEVIKKVYELGRKYSANFKQTMRVVFDDILPQWNYRAIPWSRWAAFE